jgi:hypothetical protein
MRRKDSKTQQSTRGKKLYTFELLCGFKFQHTVTESELMPIPDGDSGDFEPTEEPIVYFGMNWKN